MRFSDFLIYSKFSIIHHLLPNPGRVLPIQSTLFSWMDSFPYDLIALLRNYKFYLFDFEKSKSFAFLYIIFRYIWFLEIIT